MTTSLTSTRARRAGSFAIAIMIAASIAGCAPSNPLDAEIARYADLDAAGLEALAADGQSTIDELIVTAAGIDALLDVDAAEAARLVPRALGPDAGDLAPAASGGGITGAAVRATARPSTTIVGAAYSNARKAMTRLIIDGFGTSVRDGGTTDSTVGMPGYDGDDDEEPAAIPETGERFTVTDGHLVGNVDATASITTEQGATLASTLGVALEMTGCPAADGSITATARFDSRLEASGATATAEASLWGQYAWTAELTGIVGDDAHLQSASVRSTSELRNGVAAQTDDDRVRGGVFLASSWSHRVELAAGLVTTVDGGSPVIESASSLTSMGERGDFAKAHAELTHSLLIEIVNAAEFHWRSGVCVDMGVAADSDLPNVEQGAIVDLTVTPVAKADRMPTGGTIVAERLEGAGVIDPVVSQPAPSTHRYRTPEQDDRTIVQFTSTSNRGIGLLEQEFRTTRPAYVIEATINEVRTYAAKCFELAGRWEIQSTGVGWDYAASTTAFIEEDTLTGTYSISGTADVFPFLGGGEASIELLPDGTRIMHLLPGETGFIGNGDFVITENWDLCEG